jgi:Family of unknown function (DUF6122)
MILHVLVPGLIAWLAYPTRWRRAWVVMLLTTVIDLDHLLATPIYDPNRCSIGFHPLHTWMALVVYLGMLLFPTMRMAGSGLVSHMVLDGIDCVWMAVE